MRDVKDREVRERGFQSSMLRQRRFIGIMAALLPVIVIIISAIAQYVPFSLSSSVYIESGKILFNGILISAGLFLIYYEGYEKIDSIVNTIIGIAIILITVFPTPPDYPFVGNIGLLFLPQNISGIFHYIFAGTAFLGLALNSIFLFTRSSGEKTKRKKIRNAIYITCGLIMILCLIFMVALKTVVQWNYWVLAWETVFMLTFGVSWLVKGEAITFFNDKK